MAGGLMGIAMPSESPASFGLMLAMTASSEVSGVFRSSKSLSATKTVPGVGLELAVEEAVSGEGGGELDGGVFSEDLCGRFGGHL